MNGETATLSPTLSVIDANGKTPKFLQIVNSVKSQIDAGIFKPGDRLPSINETSAEYYLARATVEKAYNNLMKSGHIISLYRKGFFIASGKTVKRVLFLTGKINETNRAIFTAVSNQLGRTFKVDIYAYEYQRDYLLDGLEKSAGNYHYFVLMPHHMSESVLEKVLLKIPAERLILLDGVEGCPGRKCAAVRYSCGDHFRVVLEQHKSLFRKYRTLNFVTTDNEYIPADWYSAFLGFVSQYGIDGQVLDAIDEEPVRQGAAYLLFDDDDLINVIQEAGHRGLTIGKDIGLVSFRDARYKSVVAGGVSVMKTDITAIGRSVCDIISENRRQTIHIPMQFIKRGSL